MTKYFIPILVFVFLSHATIAQKKSLYNALFLADGTPHVTIETNLKELIRKSRKEEYQPGYFSINQSPEASFTLPGRLRARGNMRKQVCRYPPVKIDFKKGHLDSLGFKKKVDRLKLVFPCRDNDADVQRLYKEYLLYDIYKVIDTLGINAKIIDVTFEDGEEEPKDFKAILVEDEAAYEKRTKAKVVEQGKLRASSLNRALFLKMCFFQYMIANTDWSVANFHNLEMVKRPDLARVVALPYDFDYSGFVGHSYAQPHESLDIETVHERYFFNYPVVEEEFNAMVKYYLSIEEDIYAVINNATYLSEKNRKNSIKYLKTYFDLLRKPKSIRSKIVNRGPNSKG